MKHTDFDVIVIGAGHAGTEAAHVVSRMGLSAALITFKHDDIGVMSCNPAIGGVGKGHLVREIDALDGLMGRVGDKAAIQYRLLNRSKGPAVHGPRIQADRLAYKKAMQHEIRIAPGLTVIEGEVIDLLKSTVGEIRGVVLSDGSEIQSKATILTSGTFLNGMIHIGSRQYAGGRKGSKSSNLLAECVGRLPVTYGRLKTGTPPRIYAKTINYTSLDRQEGDAYPVYLSFKTSELSLRQTHCSITETNTETHEIIRKNVHLSAIHSGNISGSGPRYCPSIEDKIVRFSEKSSHQIFLEPEGHDSDLVYPNGISTALPENVQYDYVRSIAGLEDAVIAQPGYAIEYDYVDPRNLSESLEVKGVPNLFFAGQINGTTGYEEAAAQGLVAGINATLMLKGQMPASFDRFNSYMGVMLDDLTTKGVSEPYRMFTSRAEYRLKLRIDNADQRLTEIGIGWGCVTKGRAEEYRIKQLVTTRIRNSLCSRTVEKRDQNSLSKVTGDRLVRTSLLQAFSQDRPSNDEVLNFLPNITTKEREVLNSVIADEVYRPYVARQETEIERLRTAEEQLIPKTIKYSYINGLSKEAIEKFEEARPESIGKASRIEGVTAASLLYLLAFIRKNEWMQT